MKTNTACLLSFVLLLSASSCHQEFNSTEENTSQTTVVVDPEFITEDHGTSLPPDSTEFQDNTPIKDLSHLPEEIEEVHISFEGEGLELSTEVLTDIRLSVRVETAITVMDEGPHCDLTDWVHGYTSWETLQHIDKYILEDLGYTRYAFNLYDHYDYDLPFPITDMDSVRAAVNTNCGDYWSGHIGKSQTPWEYPCGVGMSAIIFRIQGTHKESGKRQYYFIRTPLLMGC